MNLTYIYEHDIIHYKGSFYHPYLSKILNRYRYFTDNITCCTSVVETDLSSLSSEELKEYRIDNIYKIVFIEKINSIVKLLNNDNKKVIKHQIDNSDLVITKLPSTSGEIAISYARKTSKPILTEMVGCVWDSLYNHSFRGKLYAPYKFYTTRKAVKQAPYVIYVTDSFLQSRYPTNGINIGCSDVVIKNVSKTILTNKINYLKSCNINELSLCTLAGLDVIYKGQHDVIRAIAYLKERGFNFQYYIAGKGTGKRLKNIAKGAS